MTNSLGLKRAYAGASDFWCALDIVANFINTLPEMSTKDLRSAIYRKCIDPDYEYGMEADVNVPTDT